MGKLNEAMGAYDDGLKVDPNNSACINGKKDIENELNRKESGGMGGMGGMGGGMGGFADSLLKMMQSNPKLAKYLADPNFLAKLQLLQTNPQLAMSDPQIMEVINEVIRGMGMNGDMPGMPPEPEETYTPPPPPPEPKKEEPKIPVNETPEEKEKRETKY